jgi:mRNA interferase MazF
MIDEGQIVLFRFPQTDLAAAKLRPALVVRRLPGKFDDWLICMMSSQLGQEISGFDEVIAASDPDFALSGLKVATLIRIARLASVERSVLRGKIGQIGPDRLMRIKSNLGKWITGP